ncbi:MAG: hypothetical protein JWO75_3525 [Actinomycetia bacterium]|jgi:hypothetical protein|nr:hypothetical protein [Actinomycetes bacterium]
MIPRWAAALESAAVRFEDQRAYASLDASLVLNGVRTAHPAALYAPAPATVSRPTFHDSSEPSWH